MSGLTIFGVCTVLCLTVCHIVDTIYGRKQDEPGIEVKITKETKERP